MGKPFEKELEFLYDTYLWATEQDISNLRKSILEIKNNPLLIIGSGGSLSACYFTELLFQEYGTVAKALTPLQLIYSKKILGSSALLFLSASGRNTDILTAFENSINENPIRLISVCMQKRSPLRSLSEQFSISNNFSFDTPAGKDGFLATNSLVAFFTILSSALSKEKIYLNKDVLKQGFLNSLKIFIKQITPTNTFYILYGGWGQPIAVDLESKLAEAALGDVLISDYRNFGHGRHHWFDKRRDTSAILALITPEEEKLAHKTLNLLPTNIPRLIIDTKQRQANATLELLIKCFHFVNMLGKLQQIDPGKPGVPDYGRSLYHLRYKSFYKQPNDFILHKAISGKAQVSSFNLLSDIEKEYWIQTFQNYRIKLSMVSYGALVFDYDGTLCSSQNRLSGIDDAIAEYLIEFLKNNIVIGIATGRGQSVRTDFQKKIPRKFWDSILIGYYNCGQFGLVSDDTVPDKSQPPSKHLFDIFNLLKHHIYIKDFNPELKPNQITIEIRDLNKWPTIRETILHSIFASNIAEIQVLESSHSMDIIDQLRTNKSNILPKIKQMALDRDLPPNCLCFGDKGKWPGNDFQLLCHQYSLSVDEVSGMPDSCWNFAPVGLKNIEAILYYLSCLSYGSNGLNLKFI